MFLGCLATTLETIVRGTHVLVTVTAGGPRVRIVNFHAVARGAQSKGQVLVLPISEAPASTVSCTV